MTPTEATTREFGRRHLRFGWWSLLGFLTLGIALEAFHGLKIRFYLDVASETRRLMWTLAHAHGTLLSLIHLIFGIYLNAQPAWHSGSLRTASRCLIGASILLPGGFFLGGVVTFDGDPGLGVLLVPVGAIMLAVAVFLTAGSTKSPLQAGETTARGQSDTPAH